MAIFAPHSWKALVARGVLAILVGALALAWPRLSLAILVGLFAAYALVDGALAIAAALRGRHTQGSHWWGLLVVGIVSIAAAVFTVFFPAATALMLLYYISAWAIVSGVFEIVAAIRLRREIHHEWLLALGGALSIALGVGLILAPGAGLLTIALLFGVYTLTFGVLLVALGVRMRHEAPRGFPIPVP